MTRTQNATMTEHGYVCSAFRLLDQGRPFRAFSFSCLVGKAHHVESFAEMGIVAA